MEKYLCIHGHFYQPPRENPWLEAVEVQDSAYPYHDWNERITAECYSPNASSRMLDSEGKIVNIVNNYASISFNFGPTLLSWMENKSPHIYQSILDADKMSQEQFSGHGSALAQAYNHMILPLANDRDKYTQVLWGLRDFEYRFGRKPEGMWLPETAVDLQTLECLVDLGIKFTILSPYQAGKVRRGGEDEEWQDATGGQIDPTMPYTQQLPSGRSITLFFYDGPISRAVAFEKLLQKGEYLADRLQGAFSDARSWPQLVHIATDGESYGHHHAHGDMGLAYALHEIDKRPNVRLTIYGEYLENNPPTYEVEIVENTAWSCCHGIERWRSNCGCNSGRSGWHQEWRKPLREALDWLRDAVAPLFEEKGKDLLKDPWQARNDYISVLLDRSHETIEQFFLNHAARELEEADRVTILKLMELQRHTMLMFTSCGWFFDDISGIETVQIIAYAGRVIQLAEELFGKEFEQPFLERMEHAKSNVREHRDGRHIYEKWIRPSVVDWNDVTAHYAVSSLFETYEDVSRVFCYTAERQDFHALTAGKAKLVVGRACVTSEITHEAQELSFGVIHFGDHNVNGGVCPFRDEQQYQELLKELSLAFDKADFPQILRLFDRGFGESTYSLKSLFRDEQRKIVDQLLQLRRAEAEGVYRRLYEDSLPTMRFLEDMGIPLPRSMRTAAEFIISTDLYWAFKDDEPDLEHIRHLLEEAQRWHVPLDAEGLAFQLKNTLGKIANGFLVHPTELAPLLELEQIVDLVISLPFEVDLWEPQNVYFRLLQQIYPELELKVQGDETSQAWLEHFQELGQKLGVQVGELKKKITELQKVPTLGRVLDEVFTRTRIPSATYRLQFNKQFTFRDAQNIIPYLHDLGISDCYASPILQAFPGSPHGYDVCDHTHLNRELGGREAFEPFSRTLLRHGMGLILDMVPNHMGIGHFSNSWWQDVLENGPSSQYADFFDIDWHPVNPNLENKLLLPVLGDQYGTILENGEIKLQYDDGVFFFSYYEHRFPVSPDTYNIILELHLEELAETLGEDDEQLQELQSILTGLRHLPSRTETDKEQIAERTREKEIIKRRLATLVENSPEIADHIETALREFNGRVGDVSSFDRLDQLLDAQISRPAFWRVATEEINYRRFFDINDLAAICVELPEVFHATHQLFFELLGAGRATGLRIDHPDGLWNPTSYFRDLQDTFVKERVRTRLKQEELPENFAAEIEQRFREQIETTQTPAWPLYVVAEKILGEGEPLPVDWAVHGTTGYDTLNAINGLFVDSQNESDFTEIYSRFLGHKTDFAAIVQSSKRMIMLVSLASEINSLSHRLDRISERNRRYRDFTLNSLTFAIREIIASLEVYRTYIIGPDTVALRDRMYIEAAVETSKKRNPRTAAAIFDFVCDTLLLRNLNDFRKEDRPEILNWVMKFQQITGPVMAKGMEDTAFYIYHRLTSLNEVGGHPHQFGISLEEFHEQNHERHERWPHSMLSTSTHDTKRSEDVRARINVLSELPQEWQAAVQRWSSINAPKKTQLGKLTAPGANDEYLLYQTLVGAWPVETLTPETMSSFRSRICNYMQKATREAKVHTSWVNPNAEYDEAVWKFVESALTDDAEDEFLKDLMTFQNKITFFGFFNSLAQTLLKLTIPGVPDTYQGTELWDFSLVDPDNRRPVDYAYRRSLLSGLKNRIKQSSRNLLPLVEDLLENLADGRAKLFLTYRTLMFRRANRMLFTSGNYLALRTIGAKSQHVCCFLRKLDEQVILVAVPRLVAGLMEGNVEAPIGSHVWGDTQVLLPHLSIGQSFRNIFTNEVVSAANHNGTPSLSIGDILAHFPVFLGELG